MQAGGGESPLNHDAIVVGGGHNGLVAANRLADAGWSVLVLEAEDAPGGRVRSLAWPDGFVFDLFSAFYPLGYASPVLRSLDLDVPWRRSEVVLAHPTADGRCAVLSTDLEETVAPWPRADAELWRKLAALWQRRGPVLLEALMTPLPPVRALPRLVGLARLGLEPVDRLAARFTAPEPGRLLTGNALHADLPPRSPGSGLYGWLLTMLGQHVGFPVPEGGAERLIDALAGRFTGRIETGRKVDAIEVRDGRAVAVRLADGERITAARAVLAATPAPELYRLLGRELRGFIPDPPVLKVDWALDGPIPWTAEPARRAGTVHLGEQDLTILGQYSMVDPTRAPPGKESAWAYRRLADPYMSDSDLDDRVAALERDVEQHAPGFRGLVVRRYIQVLPAGAVNLGTARLRRQLFLRPVPRHLGRPEVPGVRGLYLASGAAHPGGGVHGGPGAIAARVALTRSSRS